MDERRVIELLRGLREVAWTCGMDEAHLIAYDEVAALDHAIATIERERWRPIAEAPKDEPILLFGAKRSPMVVGMHHSRDGWVIDTPSEWASMYPPTHWRPLPDPQPDGQEG